MTSATSFGNINLEFLDLPLGSEESAQLYILGPLFQSEGCDTRFLANLRALLSLLFLNNSIIRFS